MQCPGVERLNVRVRAGRLRLSGNKTFNFLIVGRYFDKHRIDEFHQRGGFLTNGIRLRVLLNGPIDISTERIHEISEENVPTLRVGIKTDAFSGQAYGLLAIVGLDPQLNQLLPGPGIGGIPPQHIDEFIDGPGHITSRRQQITAQFIGHRSDRIQTLGTIHGGQSGDQDVLISRQLKFGEIVLGSDNVNSVSPASLNRARDSSAFSN